MYLLMNYRDLINTVFPVNCLIYTVRSPARSYPFAGYSDLDYTPRTIQCVQCTSINADYQLHSLRIVCYILPGPWRGGLSSLAAGERKGGSSAQEGGAPNSRQRGNRAAFCPFPSWARPFQTPPPCPSLGNVSHKDFSHFPVALIWTWGWA